MNILTHNCYKSLLRDTLESKKKLFRHYTYQAMAEYCSIQKTYLSKVLNRDDTHLSEDQLFLACDYLQLSEEETDFTHLLHAKARTSNEKRRDKISRKISDWQRRAIKSEKVISSEKLSVEETFNQNTYYLNPLNQIVHMFLTIDRYAKNIKLIMKDLSISQESLEKVLMNLESLKIIKVMKSKVIVLDNDLHLSEDSVFFPSYISTLRSVGLGRLHFLDDNEKYNFSVTFSADEEVRLKIKKEFLNFLKKIKKVVDDAPCENVYQVDFSLFPWSSS